MANKSLFGSSSSTSTKSVPAADTINNAGGVAYSLSDKAALAQMVVTGVFGDTFYVDAKDQLDQVLELAQKLPIDYVAKLAIYAREKAYMKDTPALLCAVLASRSVPTLKAIFNDVIDNGKMLRNFVQIIRSGKVGRKSFGTAVKKLVQRWIEKRSDDQLFRDSVGNDPSLADVIKMVHPRPKDAGRATLYGYITGNVSIKDKNGKLYAERTWNGKTEKVDMKTVPSLITEYEIWKQSRTNSDYKADKAPNVPFQMLTALGLGQSEWTDIAKNAKFTMTRMNLNNFLKYDVFKDKSMVKLVAARLSDKEEIKNARVFPYQLLTAFQNIEDDVPTPIKNALQDAMEIAIDNIPEIDGKVYVCVDTSGSMSSSATGNRGSVTSKTRCIDVAALVGAAILRKNPDAEIIPFDTSVHKCSLNGRDSVMTNASKLASYGGGGTNCSSAVKYLNDKSAKGDLIIFISDNESWADGSYGRATGTVEQFRIFKTRNPKAKMINIDIVPNRTTQTKECNDIINIGGFSDTVFDVISSFANGKLGSGYFVNEIEKIQIPQVDQANEVSQPASPKLVKKYRGKLKSLRK